MILEIWIVTFFSSEEKFTNPSGFFVGPWWVGEICRRSEIVFFFMEGHEFQREKSNEFFYTNFFRK